MLINRVNRSLLRHDSRFEVSLSRSESSVRHTTVACYAWVGAPLPCDTWQGSDDWLSKSCTFQTKVYNLYPEVGPGVTPTSARVCGRRGAPPLIALPLSTRITLHTPVVAVRQQLGRAE
jgi:hypothetical protein